MSNMDDFYRPYLTTNETRYNELLMVADYRMVSHRNNTDCGVLSIRFQDDISQTADRFEQ